MILYLLPAVLKPTGRPQLPVSEAQENFVRYETDIRRLNNLKKKAPHVIIICNDTTGKEAFQKISQIALYIDGHFYICNTVLNALDQMFKAFYVFHIDYPPSVKNSLFFIQKYFYKMTIPGEKCSSATTQLITRLQSLD